MKLSVKERAQLVEAMNDCIDANRSTMADGSRLSMRLFIEAVEADRVEPDDNDGLIRTWAGAVAFGAFMSAGDWWTQ